jgi:hypothetical protein
MKRFLLLFFALLSPCAHAAVRYEDLVRVADEQNARVKQEGIDYAIGGALGLGLSVGLGIQTKEALPKLGYSLIQVLSAASVAHGASLYYQGDGLTREGDRLRVYAAELEKQGVPAEKRKAILDGATTELVRREIARYRELRKIRGYLELTSAGASGLTLALSKSKSTASSTALGFIILISLVGSYSDLLGPTDPDSMKELYAFSIAPEPHRVSVAWNYRF